MGKFFCITALLVAGLTGSVAAQEANPYQEDIETIRHFDEMYAPPQHPVLFTGSSSIRKWEDLERTFSSYVAMNRGFGGSTINDVIHFADQIIFNYHPRQIIMYAGENDLLEEGVTADTVFNRFKNLYGLIRKKLPQVPFDYISIKPSPVREKYIATAKRANQLIRAFLAKEPNTAYIDVFPQMVDRNGRPRQELFVEDMLHMNKKGYAIWEKAVKPYLVKQQ
ncbi:MAG TPA: GDSL-type esterase/lipase family protein [Chitinophaga sp.]|uniref:GDSL-type esterase/lipase family protein n=1 Tax=Chitinophaga sp. TaxID=1869181 RepID=UPI002CA7BDAA|nr:GDSL-type esterase/lipase family protein [Chitinophaga sp.]HVI48647.1 GDSL-type esterase/lipase family protein [Chitinophaga sp.]